MTEKLDAQTKIELLKLTVELTKFAVEKGACPAIPKEKVMDEVFKQQFKLINDAFKSLKDE